MTDIKRIALKSLKKKPWFTVVLGLLVVSVVVLSLLPPQILKIVIDNYLLAGKVDGLVIIGIFYVLTYVLIGAFDFCKNLMLTVLGEEIVKNIRFEMNAKMSRLKAAYFTANSSGSISARFIVDVENVSSLFTDGVVSMIIDSFKIVGIVWSIWIFNWNLGAFALCLVPVIIVITQVFRKHNLKAQRENLMELGNVNNHISETIRNMVMIKTFNREKYMEDSYKVYLRQNYMTNKKVNYFDSCYSPIIQVLTAISVAVVLYFSMGSDNALGITIGMVAAAINYITNLFQPIDSLGMELQSIQKGISGIQRVNAFLGEEEDVQKILRLDENQLENGIDFKFENMSFYYVKDKYIFKNVNAEIKRGENVVFTGRTGLGKTTLFRLIVGNLTPTYGKILINGVEASKIDNGQKRKIFGYVQQDFSFIEGNIWQQITLGDESISHQMVRRAVDFVGMSEYIEGLPQGFDTLASDNMFSQGQKQLLSIARAIVYNPPVLLLDEVTSGLDTVTEERVVSVLKRAGNGKTILSIAHRHSTIDGADRVIDVKNM